MSNLWMIRAGKDSLLIDDFLEQNAVAIGWPDMGPIEPKQTKPQLLQKYKQAYPNDVDGRASVSVSQIWRFFHEIKIGDNVITYDRDRRLYTLGEIISDVEWKPDLVREHPRMRHVRWTHQLLRDQVSVEIRNTLGAIQTLFLVKPKFANELLAKAVPLGQELKTADTPPIIPPPLENDLLEEVPTNTNLVEKAAEAIEERIVRLDWESTQQLFAGILRAMGYRTTVSPRGSDRGVDIFASPDGLGLEEPRIFVEVKHRPNTAIGSQDVRSFIGGRSSNDKCLYVSTGGFTKDARYEAERSNIPLQLISLTDLRRLLVDNYDRLDEQTRSLIPLRRIYILAD